MSPEKDFTSPFAWDHFLHFWFVVSTHLKNISQIGNLPQIGVKIKNIWNHHLDFIHIITSIEDLYLGANAPGDPGHQGTHNPQVGVGSLNPPASKRTSHAAAKEKQLITITSHNLKRAKMWWFFSMSTSGGGYGYMDSVCVFLLIHAP